MATALFIGRFQPFHNAHLKVIRDILKENNKIIIVIGSSQENNTKLNPFSLKERKEMIISVLKTNKIRNYRLVPIHDVYNDRKWVALIEKKVKHFDVLYTGNPWTIRCFKKYSHKVKRIKLIRGISSTIIRNAIIKGKNWKRFVPEEIYSYVKNIYGDSRIKNLYRQKV